MNIPEGWKLVPVEPTTEQLAAQDVPDQDAYGSYIAMVAAAPTPPAQEAECPRPCNGRPDSTTMAECILAGECGCTVKGHEYAQRKTQEAEPVAYIDKRGSFWSVDRVKAELEDGNLLELRPVYTHPANDELRKAAEDAEKLLTNLESGYGFESDEEYDVLENLRSALEGKS